MDALLDASPPAPSRILDSPPPDRITTVQRAKGLVVLTTVVLLAVVMVVCLVGVAIIPRFDRRVPLAPLQSAAAREWRGSPSRDAP